MGKYRVGIDVGGTFTDLVALGGESGDMTNVKVPSNPRRLADGVIEALTKFLESGRPEEIDVIMHATTVATNAILGQVGLELPKAALVTTKGFRDVLEIGRQKRPELYNLFVQKPKVLIQRRHRYEVDERVDSKGREMRPVRLKDVKRLAGRIRKERFDSVVIGLLNSYANSSHEEEIKGILQQESPELFLTASCEISPEYREYERMSTAVLNAVLIPIVSAYLRTLAEHLNQLGVVAPFYVMKSNGGIASHEAILSSPVTMIESGPTSGVIAAAFYGALLETENILSFDMGGTTAKAGLVKGGNPEIVTEYEVGGTAHRGRIIKGSGYPVRLPFVDLVECSAGGGTIAWVDEGGGLRVGPTSAGAHPGPACYGLGGIDPTITDANLILGRLNPAHLLGGRMTIHREMSEKAMEEKICSRTGLDPTKGAMGIVRIANSEMAKILRMVSVERGHDPRSFTLMAFGGAGPMHCCALAEELGMSSIIVPVSPGLFSALGLLAADLKHTLINAVVTEAAETDNKAIEKIFEDLEREGRSILKVEGVALADMDLIRELDARYSGQAYELTIPAARPFTVKGLKRAADDFHARHRSVYGYAAEEEPVELVNARLTAIGLVAKPELKKGRAAGRKPAPESVSSLRNVFFEKANEWVKTPVYLREKLKPGNAMEGPTIIEQYDATTVVYPDWNAQVDRFRNICLRRR